MTDLTDPTPPTDTSEGDGTSKPRAGLLARLRRGLIHTTESHVLVPLVAFVALSVMWAASLNLIKAEHDDAEHAASASARELAETYKAQVMRSLREIDQTLKLLKYEYEIHGRLALEDLKERNMLPPPLVFLLSVTDADGKIISSTHHSEIGRVLDRREFAGEVRAEDITVNLLNDDPRAGTRYLQFSRRLKAPTGGVSGIVTLTVDAAYFVSGYDAAKLGQHGLLGVVGADGIFRVRRSGDSVTSGGSIDYNTLVPALGETAGAATLSANAWDGVQRYISASPIYGFPLAVVVGLSEQDQLAQAQRNKQLYLWRASGGSLLILLIVGILGYLSRQLAISRQRAVQEQMVHAARIEYLAFHDGLTGLPNRSLFSKLLIQSISQARRHTRQLAVLFLDLDRFKYINDSLGHEAGDQLLREVATRLRECLRDSDTVARLGGDEFVVLVSEVGSERYLHIVSEKIISAIARPFMLFGHEFRVTVSIGISVYPQDGLDEQTLTKNADSAMYQAKKSGKNNFQFYSDKFNVASLERLTLEAGLRRALEQNEFTLHYQAKRDMQGGRITGLEALLRWEHPALGTLLPRQFLSLAEETGLIVPIGRWVLRAACRQVVVWQNQGLSPVTVAVNLTARQFFDKDLVTDLKEILASSGMDREFLELEITESLLMGDPEGTLRVMRELREMGIRLAIDDFGTGYSSLARLARSPLNTVKIDRSYVREVPDIRGDNAMTEAIIAIGRMLSPTIVAQGVETREQVETLRQSACDEFQGFYFSRPMPAAETTKLLREQGGGERPLLQVR